MAIDRNTTAEELRARYRYDPDTGLFWWREPGDGRNMDRPVGSKTGKKKKAVIIGGRLAHRLAWLYVYGEWPAPGLEIDHINGDSEDNRIANLRLATPLQNKANRIINCNNTSGFKGVSRVAGAWQAQIKHNYKTLYLGRFDTPEEAHAAYQYAATTLKGPYARFK